MQDTDIAFADGRIVDEDLPEVDMTGFLILPGIIDLHGDGFEANLFPRPTAGFPMATALAATDRLAAAHGVTTAYLAQSWSWEGGHRGPEQAEALCAGLAAYRPRAMVDLRVQIRAETHLVDQETQLIDLVRRHKVGFVVFNNHLDEGLQTYRSNPAGFAFWARKAGTTVEELHARIQAAQDRARDVPRSLCRIAEAFDEMHVTYGSHDDPDGETREFFAALGARIAEFPTARNAAAAAKAMSCPVLMGAPNVVRGGSQAGNISASDLIRQGLCDALVSDYHMPALAEAAWTLVDRGWRSLEKAWAMISSQPAEILGLADRGRLSRGKRADMVIINAQTRAIEATISGGRLAYLTGEAAARLMAPSQRMLIASE